MRIIAGRFRSRRIKSVPGMEVRPTPDRLREALFNVLAPRIKDTVFLDVYAGTGVVGIEALSRGAKRVIFIEFSPFALRILNENLRLLEIEKEVTVVRGTAATLLPNYKADIAFIDPPYDRVQLYSTTMLALLQTGCPFVVAQHHSKVMLSESYGDLKRFRILKQGDNTLSFYKASST